MKPMTQSELEKISEMVAQGIVASKQVDSMNWADVRVKFAILTEEIKEMRKAMEYYAKEKEKQNGRVGKLENKSFWISGGLGVTVILGAIILSLAAYTYNHNQQVQDERIMSIIKQVNHI